ncbi:hypothetical protein CROQUDRAFT_664693 [Cronartium quercuum f. sp. fusiforme G11]|uniref:Uncharacterized protein n=1 Tax=Cronartium quercuum f. sp. fusiforme G11 TaxID=708437 RepID=A0A9P6N703_9BASI|nr:hypothetical protein CROQUDRAFT_664693 [Cronartium quercuum f. sp. fusiforme G11]
MFKHPTVETPGARPIIVCVYVGSVRITYIVLYIRSMHAYFSPLLTYNPDEVLHGVEILCHNSYKLFDFEIPFSNVFSLLTRLF